MKKEGLYKRITLIAFVAIIVFFGMGTVLRCDTNDIKNIIKNRLNSYSVNAAENVLLENFKLKEKWVETNGLFHRLLGSNYIKSTDGVDVYRLSNKHIVYNCDYMNMEGRVSSIRDLSRWIEEKDMSFVYVQLPFMIEDDSVMPMGSHQYARSNAERLVDGLHKEGVHTIDLYTYYADNTEKYEQLFYTTDHHWEAKTAMHAGGIIAEELKNKYGLPFDYKYFSEDFYDSETYKASFLGSLGKRVGKYYAGVDDITIYNPKVHTNFTFVGQRSSGEEARSGAFIEALMVLSNIDQSNLYSKNPYAAYIGGDYKINHVVNELAENDAKVLMVRDSFSCALQPFLCMNYRDVTAIDLRHYNETTLKQFLLENEYDVVMLVYNPSSFENDKMFTFE